MSNRTDDIWRDAQVARKFLEEVVGAIPLEAEQLDIMMRLISHQRKPVRRFLDVGCGNGILGSVILNTYPDARGVLLDFSDTMLCAAKEKLRSYQDQVQFIQSDYGDEKLTDSVQESFDVIVSRFSIHHQPDERKYGLYKEIYDLLIPGGIFINIEHVSPQGAWGTSLFEEYMVDHLYRFQLKKGQNKDREEIAREFHSRHDKDVNIVAPVDKQCSWLREIGFTDVDCYFKVFEIAIFSGIRKDT